MPYDNIGGKMTETMTNTLNWPDPPIGLYDRSTGRGAEITCEFDNMPVAVPSTAFDNASYTNRDTADHRMVRFRRKTPASR